MPKDYLLEGFYFITTVWCANDLRVATLCCSVTVEMIFDL